MNKETAKADVVDNSFLNVLTRLRGGGAVEDLSTELQKLIARVRETGRAGTLNLSLTITPISRGNGNALDVKDRVSAKLPEYEIDSTVFFADDDNSLHRNDPRQKEMEFSGKTVPAPPAAETTTTAAEKVA